MKQLHILVEGDLEVAVLKSFLKPFYHANFGDKVSVIKDPEGSGNGYFTGRFVVDVQKELDEADTYVLCLFDLYEEPYGIYRQGGKLTVEEGFAAVKNKAEGLIHHKHKWRFAVFPVVMEIETWLFADSAAMRYLNITPDSAPENIPHPAATLAKIDSGYNKLSTGTTLFRKADAERVYADNCPHFKQLADWLKTLPSPPKSPPTPTSKKWMDIEKERQRLYDLWQDRENESNRLVNNNASDEDVYQSWERIEEAKAEYETYCAKFTQSTLGWDE